MIQLAATILVVGVILASIGLLTSADTWPLGLVFLILLGLGSCALAAEQPPTWCAPPANTLPGCLPTSTAKPHPMLDPYRPPPVPPGSYIRDPRAKKLSV